MIVAGGQDARRRQLRRRDPAWSVSDDAAWLDLSPGSGVNSGTVAVQATLAGLTAGTYTADVTITAGAQTKTLPVTFTVDPKPFVLGVAPSSLSFSGIQGGADPTSKTCAISNGGDSGWTGRSPMTRRG
jgi:hypothetical protein